MIDRSTPPSANESCRRISPSRGSKPTRKRQFCQETISPSTSKDGPSGWLMSIVGAVVVLWGYVALSGRRDAPMQPSLR